ncbi:MAG: DUF5106 domain-containing protein [Candidatus Limimorpha sp.]
MKHILFLILFSLPITIFCQTRIEVVIDNQQDSILYLQKYRGSKPIDFDTAFCRDGRFFFESDESYPEGIYILRNSSNYPITEILIGKDRDFSLIIKDLENIESYEVKGAEETGRYYKIVAKQQHISLNIKALESEKDSFPENVAKIDSLKKVLADFEESMKMRRKKSFINTLISSLKRHGIMDYWDDFPFCDSRVLTYPLIDNKLDTYFDYLPINPETINAAIDDLVGRASCNKEVRDYILWHLYRKYFSPNYMNLDEVFIHLSDEYFSKLDIQYLTESIKEMIMDRADNLRHLTLGAKIPEIDNLYAFDSPFTLLVFFDKTCQKCAQEGRKLEEICQKYPEVRIFPVEIHRKNGQNLISEYDIQSTPLIYLLDKEKRIVAKRIKAEQVEQFLIKE